MAVFQTPGPGDAWVLTVAKGPVTYLDVLLAVHQGMQAGSLARPQFIDATAAVPDFTDSDLADVVALVRAVAARGPVGPVAILVDPAITAGDLTYLATEVADSVRLAPFHSHHLAERWLRPWGRPRGTEDRGGIPES